MSECRELKPEEVLELAHGTYSMRDDLANRFLILQDEFNRRQPEAKMLEVELGHGKVEIADGNHYGKPALLFGRNGCGEVGKEMNGDRYMEDGELIAAVTFDNLESLNVVLEMLNRCRARCFAAALPPAQSAGRRAGRL